KSGRLPSSFNNSIMRMYARSFLYALDVFSQMLSVLAQELLSLNIDINQFNNEMTLAFPDLRGVRNTSHHPEDRLRGLGAGRLPKPMILQPVQNEFFSLEKTVIMDSLINKKFGSTMACGNYGEVDVSIDSMTKLQTIFQNVLNALPWTGPHHHYPS
ncbi:MAG: hypothetical protein ACK4PR_12215, partial [Gammaproteobacteria bacterium]